MAKKICIAPGHGGFDPGAVGNGLKEKDINLAVSLDLQKLLEAAGIPVVMTRTTDEAAGGATTVQADLENQCKIANESKADLFFSIHTNAGGGHGAEAYVMPGSPVTVLAANTVRAIAPLIGIHGEAVKDGNHLWVIRHTNMPAILLELGFIDSTDATTLRDRLHEFAKMIAPPLVSWLGGDTKALQSVDVKPPSTNLGATGITKDELESLISAAMKDYVTKAEVEQVVQQAVKSALTHLVADKGA
ncbi:MAG: N-acetylmuramoyl-L-alanine amidase [Alicyclobacillus sp.]|nr:N-acetylmuramoyl-L-alanine amidase [Alicyclobacillus sp.]